MNNLKYPLQLWCILYMLGLRSAYMKGVRIYDFEVEALLTKYHPELMP